MSSRSSERADEPACYGDRQRGGSDQAEVDHASDVVDLTGARRLAAEDRVHAGSPPRHADESLTDADLDRSTPGGRVWTSAKATQAAPASVSRRDFFLLGDLTW